MGRMAAAEAARIAGAGCPRGVIPGFSVGNRQSPGEAALHTLAGTGAGLHPAEPQVRVAGGNQLG